MEPTGGLGGQGGGPGGGYYNQQQQQQQPMMMPMHQQQQQGIAAGPFPPGAFPGGLPQAGQGRPGRAFDRHDPAFYKTRMCTQFQDGTCTYGDRCTFAHSADELRRPAGDASKMNAAAAAAQASGVPTSRICFRWSTSGACHFGSRCAFEHILPPAGAVVGGAGGSDSISKPGDLASGIARAFGGAGGGGGMPEGGAAVAAGTHVPPPPAHFAPASAPRLLPQQPPPHPPAAAAAAPAPRPGPKPSGGAAAIAASRARAACVVLGVGAAAATAAAAGGLPQGAAADVAAAARARAILAASPWADDCSSYC